MAQDVRVRAACLLKSIREDRETPVVQQARRQLPLLVDGRRQLWDDAAVPRQTHRVEGDGTKGVPKNTAKKTTLPSLLDGPQSSEGGFSLIEGRRDKAHSVDSNVGGNAGSVGGGICCLTSVAKGYISGNAGTDFLDGFVGGFPESVIGWGAGGTQLLGLSQAFGILLRYLDRSLASFISE
jgi:hypothetical protein